MARLAPYVALLGVLVALVGVALLLRPLSTPTQDCGTSIGYLLDGRVDEYADPADPPGDATRAEAVANNAEPCQERAAGRARPAGVLVVGGTALGLLAAGTEVVVRWRGRRARYRAHLRALLDASS